ncbi:rRNA maturation RNase YbeY [Chelativorans sp. Marseille-P2723]|uniref:rRNA maturation RNase YbeY n=1 Tax=Chelativorans sp. Marseille-P2723 TaxID=2709133 RepID=UPI001570FDD4|nr:rRNA maturation RNase YbeY [Chelativorans sp. Marseille-P2723]
MTAGRVPAGGIIVESAVEALGWPPEGKLQHLAQQAILAAIKRVGAPSAETVSIVFTDDAQMEDLNARFRGKNKPTNVLSFPAADMPVSGEPRHLGDIVLAYETVASEAEADQKPFDHHLTHLLVHGFLHLLGYDHETPEDAEEMENLEREILESLAIGDPYA